MGFPTLHTKNRPAEKLKEETPWFFSRITSGLHTLLMHSPLEPFLLLDEIL